MTDWVEGTDGERYSQPRTIDFSRDPSMFLPVAVGLDLRFLRIADGKLLAVKRMPSAVTGKAIVEIGRQWTIIITGIQARWLGGHVIEVRERVGM